MTMFMEPLFELQRDLNRLLAPGARASAFVPAADVLVSEEDVTVHMDVPGLTADTLDIELQDDVLTVRGERTLPYATENAGAWQRIERGFGAFERTLRVPRGLDPDAIEAALADGVLTLRIPKPERLKPRRVQITAAQNGEQREQRELAGAAA